MKQKLGIAMESLSTTTKKDRALDILSGGGLLVHVDPRGDDVWVPFRFKHLSKLALPIGLRSDTPGDLIVDDKGLSCTLFFNQMRWVCRIPWRAVFALAAADGNGSVWLRDIPEDSRPGDDSSDAPIAIPTALTDYLVVNGQAI
ncbi:MAG TPA: hypothetical protein VK524_30975, partial [Polyangiaceae bacterium]|nr:hypothetical protein [Polyangiaceae bacterium]